MLTCELRFEKYFQKTALDVWNIKMKENIRKLHDGVNGKMKTLNRK
jgi:hypothetical protein